MNIYVYENTILSKFYPLSSTKACFEFRISSDTFLDRIKKTFSDCKINLFVRKELRDVVSHRHPDLEVNPKNIEDGLWLVGNAVWNKNIIPKNNNEIVFFDDKNCIGAYLKKQSGKQFLDNNFSPKKLKSIKSKRIDIMLCRYLWDIIDHIGKNINDDKKYFAEEGKLSENLKFFERNSKNLINSQNILIGKVEIQPNVVMDATAGPIVIDDNVTIKSNTHLEGPLYVGCGSTISPLTYVKNSVIGPLCKIGGELNSVVVEGYTNKVHYGFLGNSYIGEWVNLGAGTSNSNLKNNYGKVRVQMNDEVFDTNRIHLGCFIGDFVKTSIGTKINTGSVYGSGSMIFSKDFPSKNIPILTWYTDNGMSKVSIDKFILNCQRMKKRRGVDFDIVEEQFYRNLFVQIEK
ncbi:MAG: hypothetical protein CBD04_005285 [bacterium TMED144]|nr:MAG: hypothetical protein CBD04_005285 [bacterium TMED144]|tara:strand:- start:1467 stop:2678 length:1212 start_codon:yes stop_codon:yes gene_type:complete